MYMKAMKVELLILYWMDMVMAARVGKSWVSTVYLLFSDLARDLDRAREMRRDVHDDSLNQGVGMAPSSLGFP
jgi:hypothetical protein